MSDEAPTYNDPDALIECPAGTAKRTPAARYRDLYPDLEYVFPPPAGYEPPRLLEPPRILYPRNLLGFAKPGFVSVAFRVGETGAIGDPQIVCSSASAFESAALDAVPTMRYSPARLNGVPVEDIGIQPLNFAVE